MTKKRSTKRSLVMSGLALLMCVSMLIGSTYAWFTDSVTSSGNVIKSGTLDIDLVDADDNSLAGEVIEFVAADGRAQDEILWEPGCTYNTESVYLVNKGSLALKYEIAINGISGDAKLLEAIDWTVTVNDAETALADLKGYLLPGEKTEAITLSGHMREEAGNEYQDKTVDGISIAVFATQYTYEEDSFDDQYDKDAPAIEVSSFEELQSVINDGGYAKLTADIDASAITPKNQRLNVPAGVVATMDLNGHVFTSKDGGGSNTMAIYIDKGAQFTLNDSAGGGKVVSSCYGVYVKQNAKFIMNGGTLSVTGNGAYDIGVCVWNSEFVMNGGTIEGQFGVWTSNYYKNAGETGLNTCSVTIADGCEINSTGYADIECADAPDTILNVPNDLTLYP